MSVVLARSKNSADQQNATIRIILTATFLAPKLPGLFCPAYSYCTLTRHAIDDAHGIMVIRTRRTTKERTREIGIF